MVQAKRKSVELNGVSFAIDGDILVETVPAWATPTRIIGNQTRRDRSNASQWVQEEWSAGLGFYLHKGPLPTEDAPGDPSFYGFYDSTVETRWTGQITLPLLIQTSTHTNDGTPDHDYAWFYELESSLYAFSQTVSESVANYNGGTNNWDESLDLTSGYANFIPRAPVEHEGVFYIYGGETSTVAANHIKKTPGGSWSAHTPSANLTNTPYSIVSDIGTLWAATYDNTNKKVIIEKSTDDGDTWAQVAGMEITEPSQSFIELIHYFDRTGIPAILLHTASGLYLVDTAAENIRPIIQWRKRPLLGGVYPHSRSAVYNDKLYLARGRSLIEYHFSGAWQNISFLNQATIPSGLRPSGEIITAIYPTDEWLFVAISGNGKNSIWAYDGLGFHYIWSKTISRAKALRDIIVSFDTALNTDVLHLVYQQAAADQPPEVLFQRLEYILENPAENSNAKFESSGYLQTPFFSGGMSEVDSAILQIHVAGSGIDSTETVTITTATEYSATFGNSLAFDAAETNKFASGAGLSAKVWSHKYTLARDAGDNTLTPVIYAVTTDYRKKVQNLHKFTFVVDLQETARLAPRTAFDVQKAWELLDDIAESITLVTFKAVGSEVLTGGATRYVEMESDPLLFSGGTNVQSQHPRLEDGRVRVVVREII